METKEGRKVLTDLTAKRERSDLGLVSPVERRQTLNTWRASECFSHLVSDYDLLSFRVCHVSTWSDLPTDRRPRVGGNRSSLGNNYTDPVTASTAVCLRIQGTENTCVFSGGEREGGQVCVGMYTTPIVSSRYQPYIKK